jgi:hypothetical protein
MSTSCGNIEGAEIPKLCEKDCDGETIYIYGVLGSVEKKCVAYKKS